MKYTGDPVSQFRARREKDLFDHRFKVRAAETQEHVRKMIDHAEKMEEVNKLVQAEMDDFFNDSTRIAARIFGSIEEELAAEIEKYVLKEMEDFLSESKKKAELLIEALCRQELPEKEVELKIESILDASREKIESHVLKAAKEHDAE